MGMRSEKRTIYAIIQSLYYVYWVITCLFLMIVVLSAVEILTLQS